MKKPFTILVNVCSECGADNWQNTLFELKFKKMKESIWLCSKCAYNILQLDNIDIDKVKAEVNDHGFIN